jgi:hypothetical protein
MQYEENCMGPRPFAKQCPGLDSYYVEYLPDLANLLVSIGI